MPRTYAIVSIDGTTGIRLRSFLKNHTEQYPSSIAFVDAAVMEKLDRGEPVESPGGDENGI
jgi:hypothetical protein